MNKKVIKIAIAGALAAVLVQYFINPTVDSL